MGRPHDRRAGQVLAVGSAGSEAPRWGAGNQMPMAETAPQPPSLRSAVRLMRVGAGVALLGTIVTLAVSGKIKTEVFYVLGLVAVVLLWRRETTAYIGPG